MELITPGIGLVFWNSVSFIIVLIVLAFFAWKPIISAIHDRENSISEALEAAKKAKEEMANLKSENEKILEQARLERERILREAQNMANTIVSDAKEKASSEANKIMESAKSTIENEKNAAIVQVRNYAANLSIDIAEKILRKSLSSSAEHQTLIAEYLKDSNLN